MLKSIQFKKSCGPTSGSATKNANEEVKRKAEKLKESRDYSFLFSDDAELPGSSANVQAKTKEVSVINSQTHQPKDTQRKLTCQRPLTSTKPLTCVPRQERVEQRKVSQELTRSPSKHRVISKPPLKQPDQLMKKKKKKKPAKMSENDKLALRMVREMCKTDRYAGRDFEDYDDESMETNFEDIIKEEKRSEKLAKKEDAEQLRLIEKEDRRERVSKKKQKLLSH